MNASSQSAPGVLGDWWGEAECWRRQEAQEPWNGVHANNRANALWLHDDPWAALEPAQRAVDLLPDHPRVWCTLGNVLQDLGRLQEASSAYQRSLHLHSDAATAFNCSKVLMGLGRFEQAYRLAEQRLEKPGFQADRPGPRWRGWPEVRQLWLWGEQGFGDVLQHLRWLVPLLQQGIAVRLELEPALVPLVEEGLAWAGGQLQVQPTQQTPSSLPPDSCHGSLLSLPLLLGGAPLAGVAPYLRLPAIGKQLVGPASAGRLPRIGLVWASGAFLDGHVLERDYRRKSLQGRPLQSLLNALAMRPLELVALQFGPDRQAPPWIGGFAAELPAAADFREAAAWLQQLDLLISVDTAAAHLAGAMGLPVWMLLPWAAEARWQLERSTTPWYPSMRLLRQPGHGDWYGLIQLLLAHLDVWLSNWPKRRS
jgi:hypothetical protein